MNRASQPTTGGDIFPAWLPALAALAYLNALSAAFQFDDYNIIVDNPNVHSLAAWWQHLFSLRPLLKLGYALNWTSGLDAFGFHATNVLLHLANVSLLWRVSAHFPRPAEWNPEHSRWARLFLTLLFALHPIQSEAVTYVSGRSMSQMALFVLAGLWLWLEKKRPGWALLCFTAAVLSKEVAVIAPLLLLLFPGRGGRRDFLPLAIFLSAAALLLALFGYQRLLHEALPRSVTANLASELNAVFYLLGQIGRPHALDIDPALPELTGFGPLTAVQTTLFAAVLVLAWRQRRGWFGFAVFWFVLLLLPTHSLIPRNDLASERHLYLAGVGLYWIVAVLLAARLPARFRPALLAVLAGLGLAFTIARNHDYRDEISLWQATVALRPATARAWNNLGYAYRLAGRYPEARNAFTQALRRDPNYRRAAANLRELDVLARPAGAVTP